MIDEPTRYQLAEYTQAVKEVGELKAERDRLRQRIDKMEESLESLAMSVRDFLNAPRQEHLHARFNDDESAAFDRIVAVLNVANADLAEAKRLKGGDK